MYSQKQITVKQPNRYQILFFHKDFAHKMFFILLKHFICKTFFCEIFNKIKQKIFLLLCINGCIKILLKRKQFVCITIRVHQYTIVEKYE